MIVPGFCWVAPPIVSIFNLMYSSWPFPFPIVFDYKKKKSSIHCIPLNRNNEDNFGIVSNQNLFFNFHGIIVMF
jgi:ATP sulfurylase